jgi:hypothetical protein
MNRKSWMYWGALFAVLAFVGTAYAQETIPWKTTPGDPPGTGESGGFLWSTVTIPGLVSGSSLGNVAVTPHGTVYVWALRREPVTHTLKGAGIAPTLEEPLPWKTDPGGPTDPNAGGDGNLPPTVAVSTLYAFDGTTWTPSLKLTGQIGASVFAGPSGEVFASTDLPGGGVRVYRLARGTWLYDRLPEGVVGPAGAFAASESKVFFRSGAHILRHLGDHWGVEAVSAVLSRGGEMVAVGKNEIMAPYEDGEAVWNGASWTFSPWPASLHVRGAWGARDAQGSLHLFATGSNANQSMSEIWSFDETNPGTLIGHFDLVNCENEHGNSFLNSGIEVWGTGAHDVYAIGCCTQCGRIMQFDGANWFRVDPLPEIPPTNGISGTPGGDLWISLANGQLLHRAGAVVATTPPLGDSDPVVEPDPVLRKPSSRLEVRNLAGEGAVIAFEIPSDRLATLTVFDLNGRRVETLARDHFAAGVHTVTWSGRGVPSGIYFCRLEAGPATLVKKIVVHR